MNSNAQPQLAPGKEPPARPRRRLALPVLVLLLLVAAGGGAYWWHQRGQKAGGEEAGTPREKTKLLPTGAQESCSDDGDPKVLEPLDFGPPIQVRFDRRSLDGLARKPIPKAEVYPWQPRGLLAVLGEHRLRGSLFALRPDNKMLAVSTGDGFIRIGSVDTLHEKHVLTCPAGVRVLAWSPADQLAVSTNGGDVQLFDVRNLERVPAPVTLPKPAAAINSLSWSADGKYLLGGDGRAKLSAAWVWDVKAKKVVNELKHTGPVTSVAFSPVRGDYRALTAGGVEDARLHLWDAPTGKKERAVIDFDPSKTNVTIYVGQVAFSPDAKRALSCHPDGIVRVWDLGRFALSKEVQKLAGHAGLPQAAFGPDGESIVTARMPDQGVWLWKNGKQVRRLATTSGVYALAFPSAKRVLFSGTQAFDSNVHIHEPATGKEVLPPAGHLTGLSSVALSPDGQLVATGGNDAHLRLWDLQTVSQRHSAGAGNVVWGVGFHPDGKRAFYYGAFSPHLPFLDVKSGKPATPPYNNSHGGAVFSAAVTRDGRYAVTGGYSDGTVRMWQLRDGRQVRIITNDGPATVTVAPDMRRAIRVGGSKTRLIHLRCGEVKHEWPPTAWAPFLADGRAVFFGGAVAPAWKVKGEKVRPAGELKVNLTGMSAGALSADGKWVAAVIGAGVVVRSMESGGQRWAWTPPAHFYGVRGVALSPDGGHLLTANGDGTAYVIRLPE
jgi:WD40 repeat protein